MKIKFENYITKHYIDSCKIFRVGANPYLFPNIEEARKSKTHFFVNIYFPVINEFKKYDIIDTFTFLEVAHNTTGNLFFPLDTIRDYLRNRIGFTLKEKVSNFFNRFFERRITREARRRILERMNTQT